MFNITFDQNHKSTENKNQGQNYCQETKFFNSKKEFGTFSIPIAHKIRSLTASVILSELIYQFDNTNPCTFLFVDLTEEIGWCFLNKNKLIQHTALCWNECKKALALLERKGLIFLIRFGYEKMDYFRITNYILRSSNEERV